MSPLVVALAALFLLAAGFWAYFEILAPLVQIRRSIRQLARRNFSSIPLPSNPGLMKGALGDVWKISEILQQFDRQVVDEGFSLRAILSSMAEGVLIADCSQRVRLVNDALFKLLSLDVSPLNRPLIEVIRKHDLQKAVEAVLENGNPKEIEIKLEIPTPAGDYEAKHLDVHIGGLMPKPQSRPMAALLVFHDVTTVRKLEASQREFLANVSHEFRTPLAIISGYVETLMDGAAEDPAMTARALQAMKKNAHRLSLLIEDLLTMSRMEDKARALDCRPSNLRALLDHVLEDHSASARARGAQFLVEWESDALFAEADERRMEQVFSNLIGNALRYGDAERLVIRVTARRQENCLCIRFADNGPGIPLGDQPHIFERFYRVHKDRSRDAGGTGLGLSIVKNIVEAHGGLVSLESAPGGGACFQIRLPSKQSLPLTACS